MPRVTYNDEADWRGVYEIKIRDHTHPLNGQKITYGRLWAQRCEEPSDDGLTRFNTRVTNLVSLFSIQPADRIIVQGCGLGFLIEAFKSAGFPNCFGLDNSPHVSSLRSEHAQAETVLIERDINGGPPMRAQLAIQTGGDTFDWVITESVVESYEDAELAELMDSAEEVLDPAHNEDHIIHMVMVVRDPTRPDKSIGPQFNQKTLAGWKAIRPAHSWVDYVGWEVG